MNIQIKRAYICLRLPFIYALFIWNVFANPSHMQAQQSSQRPNILFIFTDDHGAQTISSYGSYRNRTPGMDRLATEGMRFANCFCTNSICAPSRATILTGKHTHITGHTTNERIFDTRQQTFPKLLQQAGYQTALIGKWHLNTEPTGFDYWDILINQGVYYNPPMIRNGQYIKHSGYTTDIITDLSIDWLRNRRNPNRPFLLLTHHKAPHRSWEPALRHLRMFDDSTMPEPPTLFDDWSNRSKAWTHAEMSIEKNLWPGDLHLEIPDGLLTPEQRVVWDSVYGPKNAAFRAANLSGKELVKWKYQRFAKDYLRTVASVDEGIGRLLEYLDQSGLVKNTVVIYSSDQGWFLGEHGLYDKRWMYEETLRMPFLVRWPGVVTAGKVNHDLVQNIDFAQTILDVAGAPIPSDMQGRSLLPLLKGQRPSGWRTSIYYHFYEDEGAHRVPRHYGVRTDRYKLMNFYKLNEWEMFDLEKDPNELMSIYDRPGSEKMTADLKAEILRTRTQFRVTDDADREVDVFQQLQQARWKLISSLGKLPSRWNVKVDILGREQRDGYRRERVSYTIGDHRIEAFVLVPLKRSGLLPGIVAIHPEAESGSYRFGKSLTAGVTGDKQLAYGLELCRKGYVVMCPDRFAYESRRLTTKNSDENKLVTAATNQFLANGSTLLGQELIELWFAADYLSRREEVHANRIGVIGHAEGGLLATLVSSINEEIRATVSSNSVQRLMDREAKTVQRSLLAIPGLEVDHVIAGVYPRPYLELGNANIPNPLLANARERYKDFDFTDRLQYGLYKLARDQFTPEMRQRAYAWFDRWLK